MNKFKIQQRSVVGIFIMIIGGMLLLSSMDIIGVDLSIGTFWPVVLIVLGIIRIINFDESTFLGFIFLGLGVYFQLRNLNVPFLDRISLGKVFWPAIIIIFGVSLILPDKYKSKKYNVSSNYNTDKESVDVDFEEEEFK